MTRKGAKQKSWTTKEDKRLIEEAGRSSIEDLCRELNRSEDAIRNRVKRLRKKGVRVSLRKHSSKLRVCPSCGFARSKFDRKGKCKICNLRSRIDKFERESADILSKQSPEARYYYDKAETTRGPRKIEKIKRKKTPPKRVRGKLDYRSMKRSEQVVIEEENFYIAVLQRELNRKARRCQRIKKDFCESQNK
ncbi:MAG: HTH domain-containing protein [Eggerthellaceae bacterium]|nr:HTH domain-containing protein [Eggerthellaceae bacterium]